MQNSCKERTMQCRHCSETIKTIEYGTVAADTSRPEGCRYSGHLSVCTKLVVACPFASHGCTTRVCRDALEAHEADSVQKHAALLNKSLRRCFESNEWHHVCLNWRIPVSKMVRNKTRAIIRLLLLRVSKWVEQPVSPELKCRMRHCKKHPCEAPVETRKVPNTFGEHQFSRVNCLLRNRVRCR